MRDNTQSGLLSPFEFERDLQCEPEDVSSIGPTHRKPRRYAVEGTLAPIPGKHFISFNFDDRQFAINWRVLNRFTQQGRVDAEGAFTNICEKLEAMEEQQRLDSIEWEFWKLYSPKLNRE